MFVRGHPINRNKNKSSTGIPKSRGISKSPRKSISKYLKCGKARHYKRDCK